MSAALAAWAILKRLPWKYIGAALAALALAILIWRAPWAERRENARVVAKYQPKLEKALQAELIGAASIGRLRSALDKQNGSIRALAAAEASKLAQAQQALAAARAHDKAREATIAGLKASAARAIPGAPCEASQAARDVWK